MSAQSKTRAGKFTVLAGEDLTGMEGRLVVLTHDTGVPEIKLPAAITAITPYVLDEGAADAAQVEVIPLEEGRNARIALKGTCSPGDSLCLADTGTAADKGKVRVLPETAGTYRVIAIAEEKGVDGQLVLCRPCMAGTVTVAGA